MPHGDRGCTVGFADVLGNQEISRNGIVRLGVVVDGPECVAVAAICLAHANIERTRLGPRPAQPGQQMLAKPLGVHWRALRFGVRGKEGA